MMQEGYTDIHAHFVYGMDDGAQTVEEMRHMLDAAHENGIMRLYATPHMTPGVYPLPMECLKTRLDQARAYCENRGYGMRLYEGAEILYTPAMEQFVQNRKLPTLSDSKCVLVEFTVDISPRKMERALMVLQHAGYRTIIAHVERYGCMYGRLAYRLKEKFQVQYQLNGAAVLQGCGFMRNMHVDRWLKDRLIDYVASDAHHEVFRSFNLRRAYDALEKNYGSKYAARLTGV